jgi:hypothetical protein
MKRGPQRNAERMLRDGVAKQDESSAPTVQSAGNTTRKGRKEGRSPRSPGVATGRFGPATARCVAPQEPPSCSTLKVPSFAAAYSLSQLQRPSCSLRATLESSRRVEAMPVLWCPTKALISPPLTVQASRQAPSRQASFTGPSEEVTRMVPDPCDPMFATQWLRMLATQCSTACNRTHPTCGRM